MEQKDAALTIVERSSKDGYNWRKYGQKLVKGIELPRSNYNRTHPNCQVKKKLECSHNGLFTATIYESVHDHHKPQPGHRQSVGASSINAQERDDEAEVLPASTGRASNQLKADGTPEPSSPSTSDDEGGEGTAAYRGTLEDEGDEVDPESKCSRRIGSAPPDSTLTIRTAREPRVVVQTLSEVDILDDGYRWRKYAQKVVKGNPNPRSYYKCTNAGCPVRKHVERAYHDPKSVITAYEGKHNHDVPTARTTRHKISMPMAVQSGNSLNGGSLVPLIPVMLRPPNHIEDGMALLLPTAPNVISLDLDVGIGQIPERSCIQKQNLTEAENMTKHIHGANLTTSGLQSPIQSVGTLPFCGNGTMEQPAYRYRVIGQGQLNGSFATK